MTDCGLDLGRQIIKSLPQVHFFPNLPNLDGMKLKTVRWIRMDDLDKIITELLKCEGYSGEKFSFIPNYSSFFFRESKKSWMSKRFIWLIVSPEGYERNVRYYSSDLASDCRFELPNLFVPVGWGAQVLHLVAEFGIIHLENGESGCVYGTHWKNNGQAIRLSLTFFEEVKT